MPSRERTNIDFGDSQCDEERPVCNACRTKSRVCTFGMLPDLSIFVHEGDISISKDVVVDSNSMTVHDLAGSHKPSGSLRLQCVRSVNISTGKYITLKQTSSSSGGTHVRDHRDGELRRRNIRNIKRQRSSHASLTTTLLSPETALAAHFGSVFGYEALNLDPLGRWIRHAWRHQGEDAALDYASQYTFASMLSFRRRDEESARRAWIAGAKALQALQEAVNMRNKREADTGLTVTIMLHYAAEVSQHLRWNDDLRLTMGLAAFLGARDLLLSTASHRRHTASSIEQWGRVIRSS